MKLLLDEHFSDEVAIQLRARGHDVLAACEDPTLRQVSDDEMLQRSSVAGRVLITEDAKDFPLIHRRLLEANEGHSGIILTSHAKYPRSSRGTGKLVRALDNYLVRHSSANLESAIHWL